MECKDSKNYSISIFLDTRRKKNNGKYPVKLRVFTKEPRLQKLFSTVFEFTPNEFESIWLTTKPRKKYDEIRLELQALENRANDVAKIVYPFNFEKFNYLLYGDSNKQIDVSFYYNQAINQFNKNEQIGTASNYNLSLKSLLKFHDKENLIFSDITPQWLKDYEKHMVETNNRSRTTVSMYLRALRTIFNTAIFDKVISPDIYPFGKENKRKYAIPAPKGTKKALSKEQLKVLYEGTPVTSDQQKAKDYWFFSYACNGMNFKDIANLQYKNISGEILEFTRAKTINTDKDKAVVKVFLTDYAKNIIEN